MPTKSQTNPDTLAAASLAALRRVLEKERDPLARATLQGLIEGDKPTARKPKRPRRKRAA